MPFYDILVSECSINAAIDPLISIIFAINMLIYYLLNWVGLLGT